MRLFYGFDQRHENKMLELLSEIVDYDIRCTLLRPGLDDEVCDDIPEEHRCLCDRWRAIELLNEGRLAATDLNELFGVMRHVVPITIVAYYNTSQHGLIFVLKK